MRERLISCCYRRVADVMLEVMSRVLEALK
jgi:hypothetical protein